MPVRGIDIIDISVIENVSIKKVLSVPVNSNQITMPKQQHYDSLEVDEFCSGLMLAAKSVKFGLFMHIIAAQAKLLHMFRKNAILRQSIN